MVKFKCIKDFWMENESLLRGNKPAFAAGVVYEFTPPDSYSMMRCMCNNQGHEHWMELGEEFSQYFEEVL